MGHDQLASEEANCSGSTVFSIRDLDLFVCFVALRPKSTAMVMA